MPERLLCLNKGSFLPGATGAVDDNLFFLLDFSAQGIKGIGVMMIALGLGVAIGMLLLGAVLFSYLLKGS